MNSQFLVFGLARLRNEFESTVSVADAQIHWSIFPSCKVAFAIVICAWHL